MIQFSLKLEFEAPERWDERLDPKTENMKLSSWH